MRQGIFLFDAGRNTSNKFVKLNMKVTKNVGNLRSRVCNERVQLMPINRVLAAAHIDTIHRAPHSLSFFKVVFCVIF